MIILQKVEDLPVINNPSSGFYLYGVDGGVDYRVNKTGFQNFVDFSAGISGESAARIAADNILSGQIVAQQTAWVSGDSVLSGQIFSEQTSRISGDNLLSGRITSLENFTGNSTVAGRALLNAVDVDAQKTILGIPIGTNLVSNGGFDTDTLWNKGSGWTIASGKAFSNATSYLNPIFQTLSGVESAASYVVSFDLTVSSGSLSAFLGSTGNSFCEIAPYALSSPGSYSFLVHKNTIETGKNLVFRASANFGGSLDNVFVKKAF